jgi:hypothetical protein
MLRHLWKNLFTTPFRRNASPRAVRPLLLEALEERCVPAIYLWIGPSGGLWSNPLNWNSSLPGTTPGVGSFVFYNSPTSSTDDLNIPSPGLGWLVMGTQAGTLTIANSLQQGPGTMIVQEAGNLQVSGSLTNGSVYNQFAGTVNITGSLQNTGQYDFLGGSILGPGTFLNQSSGQPALLIVDSFNGVTIGANLQNYNNIIWASGNINLQSTLTNNSGGAIGILTPSTMSGANGSLLNNSGAAIVAATSGTAKIDVPLGSSNTNYGLINVTNGGLEFGLGSQFTNEGGIFASVNNSNSSVTFDGPFLQLANTQNGSTAPATGCFVADTLSIKGDVIIDAGTLDVLGGAATVGGSVFSNSLTLNSGGSALVTGLLTVVGSLNDSGLLTLAGGTVSLGLFGQFDINAAGTFAVDPALMPSVVNNGPVYNSGAVTLNPGAHLVLEGVLYTQTGSGVTNLNGSASPGGSVIFTEVNEIDQAGGVFIVSNATVNALDYTVEAGAALHIAAGTNVSSFNGDVTINGRLDFADGNNVTVNFNNNLTLGAASAGSTAFVSLYLTDVVNVAGTTTFGAVEFDFLNVPATPTTYQNLTFGTIMGAPAVLLPPGWSWTFLPGGVMEIS